MMPRHRPWYRRFSALLPVLIVSALVAVLAYGLTQDPRAVPSALIDKPAPTFVLPALSEPDRSVGLQAIKGQVALVNVWASWCVACRSEVSLLADVSRETGVPVLGLNYKDDRAAAQQWLQRFGNPFAAIAWDGSGATGIDWGVSGVPETFLLDAQGIIRDKITGALTEADMRTRLLPAIQRLQAQR